MNAGEIISHVSRTYPRFGVNKQRETARLLYEIAKREKTDFRQIVPEKTFKTYQQLKRYLIKRRYPVSAPEKTAFYLPKLEILPENKAETKRPLFAPGKIFAEEAAAGSCLAARFRKIFPEAEFTVIKSLKNHLKEKDFSINDYNRRTENIFLMKENYDFHRNCPCTGEAADCGYSILNLGFGCPYECSYCFLQEYQNVPGMVIPCNLGDFFRNFDKGKLKKGIFSRPRIGSGEFMDSLVFDALTGFSAEIMDFFRGHPDVTFEFKTKSAVIENILNSAPVPNIVVSWSLNTDETAASSEFCAPVPAERIAAAKKCSEAGHKVGFHFDPLIRYETWEKDYEKTVNALFDSVKPERVEWISLGTLRFHPPLKKIIENRFPENSILDDELVPDFDGKLRYGKSGRIEMYRKMARWIRKRAPRTKLYLCMESQEVWKSSLI